jgi:hypothetical protein
MASIKKENEKFFVRTILFSKEETVLHSNLIPCFDEHEAKKRCRSFIKEKVKRQGYVRVEPDKIPDFIVGFLAADLDKQLTPQEIIEYVKMVRRERYIVLMDNTGLEDCFDLGVEYLAYDSGDPDTIDVCDKFGTLRGVYHKRIASVEKTENATLIEKKILLDFWGSPAICL